MGVLPSSSNGARMRMVSGVAVLSMLLSQTAGVAAQQPTTPPPAEDGQATPATSEDEARVAASRHFRNGVELFEESAFEDALVEFREAYATFPNPVVLYNIGQTFLALRRYVEAGQVLREYIDRMGSNLSAARRNEVETQLEALRRRIGRIRFAVNIEGSTITIDGNEVGNSPIADPVPVNIGSRRVVVSHEGYQPVEQTVTVAADQEIDVNVTLEVATVGTVTQTVQQPEEMSTGMRVAMWSTLGASVVLGGVTIWSTLDTYQGDDAYREDPTRERWEDGQRRLHRTYGLMAATAALGISSLVIGLVGGGGGGGSEQPPATSIAIGAYRDHAIGVITHRF